MISLEKINWDNWPPWLRGLFYFWPVMIGVHLGVFFLAMYFWGASLEGSLSDMTVLEAYLFGMIIILAAVWVIKIFAIGIGRIYHEEETTARKVRNEKASTEISEISTATGAGKTVKRRKKPAAKKTRKLKKSEKKEYLEADAGDDIEVEEGSEVFFDGTKTMSSEGVSRYEWDFDDGQTGGGETTSHVYEEPGEYHATLKVTDKTGKISKDRVNIIVEEEEEEITSPPEAHAGEDRTVKVGEEVEFDASESTDEVGIVRYIWYFGDWKTGYGEKVTHTFDEPGSYSVRLIVSNDGGYSDQDIVEIKVEEEEAEEEIEEEGLTSKERFVQAVNEVSAIDEAKAEELYESGYHDLEDIIIEDTDILSEVLNISESLADEIKTVAREEAISTVSQEEEVSPPTAVAGKNRTVKVGEEVGFDGTDSKDKIGIESYEWDFDDGETAEGMLMTHAYQEVGEYEATLRVTNESGLVDEDTIEVKVEEKEVEELSEEEMLESLTKVKGIGSSTAEQVYDNGFTNYEKIVEASIEDLTAVPNVTESRAENLKEVAKREAYEPPKADAGENRNGVVGEEVELDAFRSHDDLGIESYEWDFGDGKTDTGLLVSHVYEDPGTYTVTLKVVNEVGLTDETRLEVEIEEKEEEGISREEFLEILQQVRGIGAATAEKIYGRGFSGFEKILEAERDELTNVPNVTEAKAERLRKLALEQLHEPPKAKTEEIELGEVGEHIEFDGSDSEPKDDISTYRWEFGDGTSEEGEIVEHTYETAGTYKVTLHVSTEEGLTDEESFEIIVEKREDEGSAEEEYSRDELIKGLTEIKGIGPSTAESIYEAGYTDYQKIAEAGIEDLTDIRNVTEERAERLKDKAEGTVKR